MPPSHIPPPVLPASPRPAPGPVAASPEAALHVIVTTVGSEATARELADLALQQRLAACIQIEAIHSIYRWAGQVVQEPEWRLWFKTSAARCPDLRAWLVQHHPYETPAIFVVATQDVTPPFMQWVRQEVTPTT